MKKYLIIISLAIFILGGFYLWFIKPVPSIFKTPTTSNLNQNEKYFCRKDEDCLKTCTEPGCYNKVWFETVMQGDCEAIKRHNCKCLNNYCIKQPLLEEDIEREIKKANYCDIVDDCVRAEVSCLLGCDVIVNKNEIEWINQLINIIKGKCLVKCKLSDFECLGNKCEVLSQ